MSFDALLRGVILQRLVSLALLPLDRLDFENVLSRYAIPVICYTLMPTDRAG